MSQATFEGLEPPLLEDPDYPPLIRELAGLVELQLREVGIAPSIAAAISESAAEHVREHFGGVPNYWSKGSTMRQRRRRARMWAEFNGNNHAELARRYGVCLQQMYRALAIARAEHTSRVQPGLFDKPAEDAAGGGSCD